MTYSIARLTGRDNYFEDFRVGDAFRHARGRTITETDNVMITLQVLNTAQGHFNEQRMAASPFHHRITFGGITAAFIIGMAAQDTGEQVLQERGLTGIRFSHPVLHGDTLYAFSQVLATAPAEQPDAGLVTFRHVGINQDETVVFRGDRTVLMKRRSHWGER